MSDKKKTSKEDEDKEARQRQVDEVAKRNSPAGVEVFKRLQAIVRGEWEKE